MLSNICEAKTHLTERVDWDEYFMSIAVIASCRSPCSRLNVGSVIVKDNRIISMGYNGFIAGAPHTSVLLDGHEQATIHSEINAITDCAKRGVCLNDSTIYITHYPCINCFKCIASCGIKKMTRWWNNCREMPK
jgi:dCMP deaminase